MKTNAKNCHVSSYLEPLFKIGDGKTSPLLTRFGFAPVCSEWNCRRVTGNVMPLDNKELPKSFTATSWRMMIETHPQPPFVFHKHDSGILIPQGIEAVSQVPKEDLFQEPVVDEREPLEDEVFE